MQFTFDGEYVRKLTAGDPDTERHFCKYFGELLSIKLRGRLRSREAVEDVRQETFLRVFDILRNRGGLDNPERLGPFVHSVARNVLLEQYRAQGRTDPMPEEWEPASHADSAEQELVSNERKDRVRRILNEMPEKDREVLRLIFYEERDKDQVCRQLGVDRDYLRVLVHRATNRLRQGMNKASTAVSRMLAALWW